MILLLLLLCTTTCLGGLAPGKPSPITPHNARAAAPGSSAPNPRFRKNLSVDEFIAEASRGRKQTSLALHRRALIGGEVNNDFIAKAWIEHYNQVCRGAYSGDFRSVGGTCPGDLQRTGRLYCNSPRAPVKYHKTKNLQRCPENQVCDLFHGTNYRGNWVQWPICADQVLIDNQAVAGGYSGNYYASNPLGSGTVSYFIKMADDSRVEEFGPEGDFRDTAGHSGHARTWSCFNCPPGLVWIQSRVRAAAHGFVL